MRLIDADALEKAIYEWMPKDQSTWMESDLPPIENLVVSIMMTIQEQPTVDAVPVIRCKDCIRWRRSKSDTTAMVCDWDGYEKTENDYCSWAKRKEE